MTNAPAMPHSLSLDAVIFGGGGAGLWLLDELVRRGFRTLLLEAHELGAGQTIASQGIIHGGLKYTLSGLLTPSAQAIREMPAIWRQCLGGEREPDLRGTRLRAEYCYLWRTESVSSKLAMIGARAGLRVKPSAIEREALPEVLRDCPGTVARLDEQVIEPASFLHVLAQRHRAHLWKIDTKSGLEFDLETKGVVRRVRLLHPERGEALDLQPRAVVLTAGGGNATLRAMAGLDAHESRAAPSMQRRPLHMVMVRGDLPVLNGHCVDGRATRITITTTRDSENRVVWQVGGQLAEHGVEMTETELIMEAAQELAEALPAADLRNAEWSTYRVDRAEPMMRGAKRPDDASVMREGNVITAWPTKLALAPRLAERVLAQLDDERLGAEDGEARTRDEDGRAGFEDAVYAIDWPAPMVARPPWEQSPEAPEWRCVNSERPASP